MQSDKTIFKKTKNKQVNSKEHTLGKPDLYSYSSFRSFLSDYVSWRKKGNSRFSHRYINLKVGCQSAGWFSDVINGRLNLSGSKLDKLMRLLEFSPRESEFFEALVQFECATTPEEKNRKFRKLAEFKETKAQLLNPDQFEYFTEWYFSAIRESLFIEPFKGNFEKLAKQMVPEISLEQAKKAIELLLNLELIEKRIDGYYYPTSKILKKDSRFGLAQFKLYQKANMNLALKSIDITDSTERDISSVGIALSKEDFKTACEEIKNLRQKLLRLSEKTENPHRVYQCNIQFFPQTR